MIDPKDQVTLAHEFAANFSRDLVTLAAGVLALNMTFAREFLGDARLRLRLTLASSWLLYIVSIGAGIWANMALTGSLVGSDEVTAVADSVMFPSQLQVLTFGVATLIFAALGLFGLIRPPRPGSTTGIRTAPSRDTASPPPAGPRHRRAP